MSRLSSHMLSSLRLTRGSVLSNYHISLKRCWCCVPPLIHHIHLTELYLSSNYHCGNHSVHHGIEFYSSKIFNYSVTTAIRGCLGIQIINQRYLSEFLDTTSKINNTLHPSGEFPLIFIHSFAGVFPRTPRTPCRS